MQRIPPTTIADSSRLNRWQSTADPALVHRRRRLWVSVCAVAILCAFLVAVVWPLAAPRVQVWVIDYQQTPAASSQADRPTDTARGVLRGQSRIAQWLEQVQQFTSRATNAWSTRRLTPRSAGSLAPADFSRHDAVLLYAAGLPAWQDDQLLLFENPRDVGTVDRAVNLTRVMQSCASQDTPVVVMLDFELRSDTLAGAVPEWTLWQLEQQWQQLTQQTPACQLSLALQWSWHFDEQTAGEKQRPRDVSYAEKLRDCFSASRDRDGDGWIERDELLGALRTIAPGRSLVWNSPSLDAPAPRRHGLPRQVPLAPVILPPEESVKATPVARRTESAVPPTTSETAAAPAVPARLDLRAVAPTAQLAVSLRERGVVSERVREAQELVDQLRALSELSEGQREAERWLESDTATEATWPLHQVARRIFRSELAWQEKRKLLAACLIFERLRLDSRLQDAPRLRQSQRVLQHVQRRLEAAVRLDPREKWGREIAAVHESLARLERAATARDAAERLAREVLANPSVVMSAPVIVTDAKADAAARLLGALLDSLPDPSPSTGTEIDRSAPRAATLDSARQSALWQQLRSEANERAADASSLVSAASLRKSPGEIQRATLLRLERIRRLQSLYVRLHGGSPAPQWLRATVSACDLFARSSFRPDAAKSALVGMQRRWSSWQAARRQPAAPKNRDWCLSETAELTRALVASFKTACEDTTAAEFAQLQEVHGRADRLCRRAGVTLAPLTPAGVWPQATLDGDFNTAEEAILRVAYSASVAGDDGDDRRLEIEYDARGLTIVPSHALPPAVRLVDIGTDEATSTRGDDRASQSEAASSELPPPPGSAMGWGSREELRFQLRPVVGSPLPASLHVCLHTEEGRRRSVVRLPRAVPPLAELAQHEWVMLPNATDSFQLRLRACADDLQAVDLRVLALPEELALPTAPLPAAVAEQWLQSRHQPQPLVEKSGVQLSTGGFQPVLFPPLKLKPESPVVEAAVIVCEVRDPRRDLVQWLPIRPAVVRPFALLEPVVEHDADAREVRVLLSRLPQGSTALQQTPLVARVELFQLDDGEPIAVATKVLSSGSAESLRLSTLNARGHRAGLRIEVNDWPNAFLYTFSLGESAKGIEPSDDLVGVAFAAPQTEVLALPQSQPVAVVAAAVLTDESYVYGRDPFRVGVDINQDRTLHGEPFDLWKSPTDIRFVWKGVGPRGALQWHCSVGPRSFRVPLASLPPGRYRLLAELEHGTRAVWNLGPALVIDGGRPKIADVRVRSPLPAELGKPLQLEIIAEDAGLSGVKQVELGWAVNGETDFTPAVKVVKAQKLADGSWRAQLPTSNRLEGGHVLLVRCHDRLGHLSETHIVPIELWTAATISARRKAESTAVIGEVRYVDRPVAGGTVQLTVMGEAPSSPQPEKNGETTQTDQTAQADADDITEAATFQATTDAAGRFVIPRVTRGRYRLTVRGRYRGSDYRETSDIVVDPPTPTNVPPLRID